MSASSRGALGENAAAESGILLAEQLAGRPTRANFRNGNLTMCSMVPMRSVL
jgi:exodeoxyribonuclease V gamma subunit